MNRRYMVPVVVEVQERRLILASRMLANDGLATLCHTLHDSQMRIVKVVVPHRRPAVLKYPLLGGEARIADAVGALRRLH